MKSLRAIAPLTALLVSATACGIFNRASVDDESPAPTTEATPTEPGDIPLRAFITRGTFLGDFALGADERSPALAADAICQAEADGEKLDGRFVAYLSTNALYAKERIIDAGPY